MDHNEKDTLRIKNRDRIENKEWIWEIAILNAIYTKNSRDNSINNKKNEKIIAKE